MRKEKKAKELDKNGKTCHKRDFHETDFSYLVITPKVIFLDTWHFYRVWSIHNTL